MNLHDARTVQWENPLHAHRILRDAAHGERRVDISVHLAVSAFDAVGGDYGPGKNLDAFFVALAEAHVYIDEVTDRERIERCLFVRQAYGFNDRVHGLSPPMTFSIYVAAPHEVRTTLARARLGLLVAPGRDLLMVARQQHLRNPVAFKFGRSRILRILQTVRLGK